VGCEHASPQVRAQAFGYRYIRQIGLFQDLPAGSRVLGKKTLELDHQTSLFIYDFENLIGGSRHPVKVVGDDIGTTARQTRRSFRSGGLRYTLPGLRLGIGSGAEQERPGKTSDALLQGLVVLQKHIGVSLARSGN
jgi:hypothetical protein